MSNLVPIETIKKLRNETGVSVAEIKKALAEAGGDEARAKEILRSWGEKLAGKKASREASNGIIFSYIHSNSQIGVLLELLCETDFVAKSGDFKRLASELTLQIAAMNPAYVSPEAIPAEVRAAEERIYREEYAESGKQGGVVDKIVAGKIKKFEEEITLLKQAYVKDQDKTIERLINEHIAKLGENIRVGRFIRYEIGK